MDEQTVELALSILAGTVLVLLVLERVVRRKPKRTDAQRRRDNAVSARKSSVVAGIFVVLLVLALVLGRPLLGVMSLVGIGVSVALSAIRGRMSR